MTTFFISQPMNGKTDEEIKADRRKCEAWLTKAFGSATIIDSFIAACVKEQKQSNKTAVLIYMAIIVVLIVFGIGMVIMLP